MLTSWSCCNSLWLDPFDWQATAQDDRTLRKAPCHRDAFREADVWRNSHSLASVTMNEKMMISTDRSKPNSDVKDSAERGECYPLSGRTRSGVLGWSIKAAGEAMSLKISPLPFPPPSSPRSGADWQTPPHHHLHLLLRLWASFRIVPTTILSQSTHLPAQFINT